MRILHVIHRYPPAIGGGEFWCAGLARWQAAQGHRVRVATLRAVDDDELWGEAVWGPDLDDVQPRAVAVGRHDLQDGVEVLRQLRQREYTGGVIIITGSRDEERLDEAWAVGPQEVIGKPIDLEQLLTSIQLVLVCREC